MILDIQTAANYYLHLIDTELHVLKGTPKVAIIQVGDNPSSTVYVNNKIKDFKKIGMDYELFSLSKDITEGKLETILDTISNDNSFTAMFIQLPLPHQLDIRKLRQHINPLKDVDGFTDYQVAKLYNNEEGLIPCTPEGVLMLLDYYKIDLDGKRICVISRSDLIGKPLIHLLTQRNATAIWCNSHTKNLADITKNNDIVVSGINKANMLDKNYFNVNNVNFNNQTIIDLTLECEGKKLYGSVNRDDYEIISKYNNLTTVGCKRASMGLLTRVALLQNIVKAYKLQKEGINK